MASPPLLLATYGTLMRSFEGPQRLGIADRISFVGPCRLAGVLYDLGRYPGAVPGEGTVHGELFRLRDPQVWAVLDRYEGYDPEREADSLFVRRQVSLRRPSDRMAWVYWFNDDPDNYPQVASGQWEKYVRSEGTL